MSRIENPWAQWGNPHPNLAGKKLNANEKMYVAQCVNVDGEAPPDVGRRLGLSRQLITKYARAVREERILHNRCGQPSKIDEVASAVVVEKLSGKRVQLSNIEFREELMKAAAQTAARLNRHGDRNVFAKFRHLGKSWNFR